MLRDGDISFRASVLLLITAGSQSETRIVTFCCKKRNGTSSPELLVYLLFFTTSDPPENTNLTTTAIINSTLRNSNVRFICTAEGSPPPHEYRFYHKGTFLGSSSSGTFQTQVTKSGLYSCVPVNKAGEGEKGSVNITIVGKSSVSCSSYLQEIRNWPHQMCRPGLTL